MCIRDSLGLIEPKPFKVKKPFRIGSTWQIVPALLSLALLALLIKRLLPKFQKNDSRKGELQQELKVIEKEQDDTTFLRKAANFAESHEFPHDEFLDELLNERDANCFQPGVAKSEVSTSRRKNILQALRERASALILLSTLALAFQPNSAHAFQKQAQTAWDEGKFQEALNTYETLLKDKKTPDLLYNIGSCHYRLEQPAQAALYLSLIHI